MRKLLFYRCFNPEWRNLVEAGFINISDKEEMDRRLGIPPRQTDIKLDPAESKILSFSKWPVCGLCKKTVDSWQIVKRMMTEPQECTYEHNGGDCGRRNYQVNASRIFVISVIVVECHRKRLEFEMPEGWRADRGIDWDEFILWQPLFKFARFCEKL